MSQSTSQIPSEVMTAWEKEADELVKKIERDTLLLKAFQRRLAAAQVFSERDEIRDEMSPSEAIVYYLRQFDSPVSQQKLRERIYLSGYPMDRFGHACRYFYTLIRRLERKGKLTKDGDEVMWK